MKQLLAAMLTTFAVTFLVTVVVTFVWNLIASGAGVVEWLTAFRFGLILGIALPVAEAMRRRERRA
jgi:hypothetical protein